MSSHSSHKISFQTPLKKSIRSQFIKQQNSKRQNDERSVNVKTNIKPKLYLNDDNLNLKGRSMTPQPQKSKINLNDHTKEKLLANSNIICERRSLTPNTRIIKFDEEEDLNYRKSCRMSKTPESKRNINENCRQSKTPESKKNITEHSRKSYQQSKTPESKSNFGEHLYEIEKEHDYSTIEREKNKIRNIFLRNMYYIDHKFQNCPCYKCLCGKCFCPMKLTKTNAPSINSVYNQDYIAKERIDNDECPYKKLLEFQYKPSKNLVDKPISTYRDYYKGDQLPKQKPAEKKEKYEQNDLPLFSNTNYNENYRDWSKYNMEKADCINPLNNLNTIKMPLTNKTAYKDCFGFKSKDPEDKDLENLLKSKRDKNPKNPLSNNFRSPFETENQAKFKHFEITQIPKRITKTEKYSNEMNELPKAKYETDYSKNYRSYRLKPFKCPARVELDKLAALESQYLMAKH